MQHKDEILTLNTTVISSISILKELKTLKTNHLSKNNQDVLGEIAIENKENILNILTEHFTTCRVKT